MTNPVSLPKVQGKYRYNVNIGKTCWFQIDACADIVFRPHDLDDLQYFLQNKPKNLQCTIIGVGSNLLVRDNGFKGIIIKLGKAFNYISHQDDVITTGASMLDGNVSKYALENKLAGLEFLSGIPGTIGGALAMNAGCFKTEIADILIDTKAINLKTGEIKIFKTKDIGYSYRHKELSEDWLFVEARLQAVKCTQDNIAEKINYIQTTRENAQPIKTNTSGSTFKNPNGHSAWKLIDKSGCRGLKIGDAQVSTKHCNFFINNGNASANDMELLINTVKTKVKENCQIDLHEEIKIIGNK